MPKVKKYEDEKEDESDGDEVQIHPDVPPYCAFRYKAGKPDRVKKVTRFFLDEETKLLHNEVKELDRKET